MSSAASPDWQLSRLRRDTVTRLRKFAGGLEKGIECGINQYYDGPGEQGWSVDQLVQILLDREERKRKRSAVRAAKKPEPPTVYLG